MKAGSAYRRARTTRLIPWVVGLAVICAMAADANAQRVVPPRRTGTRHAAADIERRLDETRVGIARIRYGGGGDWYGDPSSLPNLLREFGKRTGIPTAAIERVIEIGDPDLFSTPILYMTGHGNVRLTGDELGRLRDFLAAGGFLYADDNYGMDESFRRMIAELYPERRFSLLPLDHPIYHCFYDLDGPPKIHEHDGGFPQGFGVSLGDRLVVFYTYQSDIGDGLEDPDVHGDPPEKREEAVRMAVNVLYYALTR